MQHVTRSLMQATICSANAYKLGLRADEVVFPADSYGAHSDCQIVCLSGVREVRGQFRTLAWVQRFKSWEVGEKIRFILRRCE